MRKLRSERLSKLAKVTQLQCAGARIWPNSGDLALEPCSWILWNGASHKACKIPQLLPFHIKCDKLEETGMDRFNHSTTDDKNQWFSYVCDTCCPSGGHEDTKQRNFNHDGGIRKVQEGRINVGFKEQARINSPEMGKWTSILGGRNSINKGSKVGRNTTFLRNKEKPEPRVLKGEGHRGHRRIWGKGWATESLGVPRSLHFIQRAAWNQRWGACAEWCVSSPEASFRSHILDHIYMTLHHGISKVPLKTNSVDQHAENFQEEFLLSFFF